MIQEKFIRMNTVLEYNKLNGLKTKVNVLNVHVRMLVQKHVNTQHRK